MDDKAWANDSLRLALQQVQDVATKPLHVEIERLTREVERFEALLRENCGGAPAPLGWFYRVRTALARAGGEQT